MGIFQIVFLAINLAVPYWLWVRTTPEKSDVVDWTILERNLARLIESDDGFPGCATLQVVDVIHELCEKSYEDFKDGKPGPVERSARQVAFRCQFSKGAIHIGWRLEDNPNSELECREPGGEIIPHAPTFNFNYGGRMRSIEFTGTDHNHQTLPYRNCRQKAARLQKLNPSEINDLATFLEKVGQDTGDPRDHLSANLLCLTYDSSPLWKPWREKLQH